METKINQIINALIELEAKGCHRVFFEYGNGLFTAKIYRGEVSPGTVVLERTVNPIQEQEQTDELFNFIENLKIHVVTTVFQCYRQDFVKGEKAGKWEKTRPSFEFGNNAMQSMQIDGSGYFITDPDNQTQYFVNMNQLSETGI